MSNGDMHQVTVTIAGRTYRMACGEGEEQRLEKLAAELDRRIGDMRASFGEIGDMRLHVMAALMLADELFETRTRLTVLQDEFAETKRYALAGGEREQFLETRLIETVQKTAERIETLAKSLNASAT